MTHDDNDNEMEEVEEIEVAAPMLIEMTCCAVHPHVALPIAKREAERFLCYECKQSERRRKYKEQRDEWNKQQKLGFRQRHTSFVVTEGFTSELIDVAKRIIEARKQRHL